MNWENKPFDTPVEWLYYFDEYGFAKLNNQAEQSAFLFKYKNSIIFYT